MKWDRLKSNLVQRVYQRLGPDSGGVNPLGVTALKKCMEDGFHTTVWENVDLLREQAIKRIENWDIRCAKQLIDIFPEAVPKRLRGKALLCFMNEKGDWEIEESVGEKS